MIAARNEDYRMPIVEKVVRWFRSNRLSALMLALSFFIAAGSIGCCNQTKPNSAESDVLERKPFHIALGKVHPPLEYRIVSFHRGRADKRLVKLAAELGFNGVQIQIEGSTVDGLIAFKEYDQKEHLIDYCHSLGMKVTIWVHELSDVPAAWMPESFGPITPDNTALWAYLDARYEWVLHDVIPNIDGLCLTVVETEIRVTDAQVMSKLVDVIRRACDRHGKSLQVRTFVWYPDEFAGVMAAVKQLPMDTVIMSKCVPQDWNIRGVNASEIGDVGGRPQIEEYDVCGEYFLRDHVANAMPPLLKRQFDYGVQHHISGICVRVDRDDNTVLDEPNEVNLWTLAMLADGATDNVDDVWNAWASNRYGADAAPGVIRALKPAGDVVAELLSLGPFAFGDTRRFPPLGDEDVFGQLHQNYWWDPAFIPIHEKAELGDPGFTSQVLADKVSAMKEADECLNDLEAVKGKLSDADYEILKTKLLTNKVQLEFRTPMAMAVLHYRRMISTDDESVRDEMDRAMQADLKQLRAVALPIYEKPTEIQYLGQTWEVGPPEDYSRDQIYRWAHDMDMLRLGEDPRDPDHRHRTIWHSSFP
jgi:hypothetical protein